MTPPDPNDLIVDLERERPLVGPRELLRRVASHAWKSGYAQAKEEERAPVAPELVARLRVLDSAGGLGYDAHALIRLTADRIEQLQRERDARNAIDPVTRLHNLCDGLAEHRRESPYDEKSWELADESYQAKCAELKAAEARLARITQAADEMKNQYQMACKILGGPTAEKQWSVHAYDKVRNEESPPGQTPSTT
jgi:hypothetical protein